MWRPEGWRNPFASNQVGIPSLGVSDALLFERGADVMLDALKKEGQYLNGDTIISAKDNYPEIHIPGGEKGWLIFIKEGENELTKSSR